MLKAHSLLYAVYICLIVSIICGALLYFATLYNQLNLFYNSNENLYIQNQSAVNFALGNDLQDALALQSDSLEVKSVITTQPFGLLQLLKVKSFSKSDTVCSIHFVGNYSNDATCVIMSDASPSLSYSGTVSLIGKKKLPSSQIDGKYLKNVINELKTSGTIEVYREALPEISSKFKASASESINGLKNNDDMEFKNDSIYFNSFLKETKTIELKQSTLNHITLKGNYIFYSKDSIVVESSAFLEDVVLKAPKITIKKGFQGSLQAFATEQLRVESSVVLDYPSVLCLYNNSENKSQIVINEDTSISGAVVLFGNALKSLDDNTITINHNVLLTGDLYCSGKLMIEGTVYGTVYTNRFFNKTKSAYYENCLINATIDVTKRPTYFVSIPLFETKNSVYGVYKKVF